MAAPKGNRFWEARSSHGADPKFKHPTDLWDACVEYFEWNENNPLWESKVVAGGDIKELPKVRAMTIDGLCSHLDINNDTWHDWRKNRKDLSDVITRVDRIIRRQKFEGAVADLMNPNIIARDLGLKETVEVIDDAPRDTAEADTRILKLIEQFAKG